MQSREYTIASLADLREELARMASRHLPATSIAMTFQTTAAAIAVISPPADREWVDRRLEELRNEFDVGPPLSIEDASIPHK